MRARWAIGTAMGLAAAVGLPQPLLAQSKSDGYKFLEAVEKRDGTVATDLLNQPGNTLIDARSSGTGEGALHIVAQRRDVVWLKFLLSKGANPNIADSKGVTPLQIATQMGLIEGIEALLEAGAQIDVANDAGETPLITAVHRRDTAMIRLLIGKGANPDRTDNSGRSARDYAVLLGAQVLGEIERSEREKGEKTKTYGPN